MQKATHTNYRSIIFLFAPLILCLTVLLKAFVAGGIVGTAGAIVLSVSVMLHKQSVRKCAVIAVACFIILTLLAVYFLGERVGGFIYEASELMHGRWNDNYGSGRLYIWRNVLQLVPERPLLGGGPDTLGLRIDAAFERFDESLGILIHSSIDAAHNEYLNILVNQGVFALLVYCAMLIASAFKWVRDTHTFLSAIWVDTAAGDILINGLSGKLNDDNYWHRYRGISSITLPNSLNFNGENIGLAGWRTSLQLEENHIGILAGTWYEPRAVSAQFPLAPHPSMR